MEYTLKLDDGTVVGTNADDEPMVYLQGGGQILPALEKALTGLAAGDQKSVKLSAEEGYGAVNPEAFREIDIAQIPEGARKVGALLFAGDAEEGSKQPIRVHEVREKTVVLDFNHPLAGKALNFDIKILSVE